jgi:basic membrane lipoprotein Med (substrate-binding protein (PBP1-ABC) superfamily)
MLKRIRLFALVTVLLLTAALSAVRAQDDDGVFRVAAVAPSATNDLAFSQSMYDTLLLLQDQMGADKFDFTFQEGTFVVDDAAVALRDWAASGEYDLIIAHGSQYGSIIEELAPDFPDVSFAWGTDVNTFGLPNVFAYTAAAEQGGFINGYLAAQMTKTKNIGVVGPIEVGDAKAYIDGFKVGATYVDPTVAVNVTYIQSFSDVTLATEAAKALVANGADVLTGSAQMVVGPIAVAQEEEIPWFGTQSSQAELSDKVGETFQVYRWDVVLKEMIKSIKEGTLGGESYTLTLENGGLEMEISSYNDADADAVAATQATIDDLTAKIASGEIVILPESDMGTAEATMEGTADMVATSEATSAATMEATAEATKAP